jgi:hypothetical protein
MPCSGPPSRSAVIPARLRTASETARARTSSSSASAAARACQNTFPTSDCANIRASTSICLRRILFRFTGIESPCFNAFRLERALLAEVFGPRPSEPLRRLAAICLSVAILRFPQCSDPPQRIRNGARFARLRGGVPPARSSEQGGAAKEQGSGSVSNAKQLPGNTSFLQFCPCTSIVDAGPAVKVDGHPAAST